jgi:hypothetical protein
MTSIELFPYHNRHIRFGLSTGVELSGVIVDAMKFRDEKSGKNMYTYIATGNMVEFKEAESKADIERMKQLKSEVDINDIIWAERLNW